MINAQRIAALANRPRQGQPGDEELDTVAAVRTLSFLHGEEDRLAMPIRWSAAACREEEAPEGADAGEVCARCPIFSACSTALMAGAPVEVRQWRDRVDGGWAVAY
ncbi:hypothetical protein AB0I10_33060 [Streptomyces sp. NPDC050636]|uniref:hypothetical protein n=1 Tax=Streptomyces sp. NPDC050636 TaxID=3154510 RepID=UPI00342C763F